MKNRYGDKIEIKMINGVRVLVTGDSARWHAKVVARSAKHAERLLVKLEWCERYTAPGYSFTDQPYYHDHRLHWSGGLDI